MADVNDYLFDPINEQFGRVRSMLGPQTNSGLPQPTKDSVTGNNAGKGAVIGTLAGGPVGAGIGALLGSLFKKTTPPNPQVGSLNPEPVEGDSLTQYIRSLTNYSGTSGEGMINQGGEMTGLGTGILQGGLNLFGQPIDYWQKILAGDPNETAAALGPEATTIARQYDAAGRGAETGMARGGARDVMMAEAPYARAGKVSDAALKLRPQAADALTGIGGLVSNVGVAEQGVGQKQVALGEAQIAQALQSLLQRRGQNAGTDANNIQALVSGLTSVFRALV